MRPPLLLLAIATLSAAAPAFAAENRPTTVAVDFATLDEIAYRRLNALALEQRVLVRLAQEGFAVVVRPAEPQILIRVRLLGDRVVIEDVTPGGSSELARREVPTADEPVPDLVQLEVAQKIVELARARRAVLAPPPAAILRAEEPPARAPPPRSRVEVGTGGAALLRTGGTDPQIRVDLRVGAGNAGLGLRVGAGFAPASGGRVSVYESQLQIGPGYRAPLSGWLALEGALLAGLLAHRYDLGDDALRASSGTRADLLLSAPVTLTLARPEGLLALELRAAPGWAGGGRDHTLGGQTLWQRSALRLEVGLAVTFRAGF